MVRDVSCKFCNTRLGWIYVSTYVASHFMCGISHWLLSLMIIIIHLCRNSPLKSPRDTRLASIMHTCMHILGLSYISHVTVIIVFNYCDYLCSTMYVTVVDWKDN